MHVERLLQINVALLASLGTCLLGMEQNDALLSTTVFLLAATSVIVTDVQGWVNLPKFVSNLVAVIALLMTLAQITTLGDGSDLIALAKLLIYLQIVLLFQRKRERDFWQIIALSLLQVVVAAALNLSMVFGILLGVYFFFGISAMCLLFVYHEQYRAGLHDTARMRATDNSGQTLNAALIQKLLMMGLQTILLTVLVFFALPRLRNKDDSVTNQSRQMTGVGTDVSLEGLQEVLEDPRAVMRVSFSSYPEGGDYKVMGEPYFHGTVLTQYTSRGGRWRHQGHAEPNDLREPPQAVPVVRQDIDLEPGKHPYLFSVVPSYAIPDSRSVFLLDRFSHQLTRADRRGGSQQDSFRYSVLTAGYLGGIASSTQPAHASGIRYRNRNCLELPRLEVPTLIQIADQIVSDAELKPDDRVSMCRILEGHFLRSGLYKYSLGASPDRQPRLDPIEDFVSNHRSGHCEYFASALTLMLRSQGIPARLVLGYHGGEYNEPGRYFVVRQLHAHAWVEAYLAPIHVQSVGLNPENVPFGVWLRLDPTPSGEVPLWEIPGAAFFHRLNQWMDYSQVMWSQYILGLNSKRQREAVYQPIADRIKAWFVAAREAVISMAATIGIDVERVEAVATWILIAALLALLAIVSGMIGVLRMLWLRYREPVSRRQADPPIRVPFYDRFETLLARFGLTRSPQQTPREIALLAESKLKQLGCSRDISCIPTAIVDAYYRIRFGTSSLDASDTQSLEGLISKLDQYVTHHDMSRPATTRPNPSSHD